MTEEKEGVPIIAAAIGTLFFKLTYDFSIFFDCPKPLPDLYPITDLERWFGLGGRQ